MQKFRYSALNEIDNQRTSTVAPVVRGFKIKRNKCGWRSAAGRHFAFGIDRYNGALTVGRSSTASLAGDAGYLVACVAGAAGWL